jgi:energy-coupling factor transporter ATP-binding protein EcfA2
MELLYLFIPNYLNLKDIGFNFSDRYHITEKVVDNALTVSIEPNPRTVKNYFDPKLSNVTALIGKNGIGKSNVFDLLKRLLTNSGDKIYFGLQYAMIFEKEGQLLCFHSLFDAEWDDEPLYVNMWDITLTSENISAERMTISLVDISWDIDQEPSETSISLLRGQQLIYYSGIFDLRNYPSNFSAEYMQEIDVSTNLLVQDDDDTFGNEDLKQLQKHKYRNTERHLEAINAKLGNFSVIRVPEEVSVIFTLASFNKRNLNSRNERTFENIKAVIGASYGLRTRKERRSDKKTHVKVSFLDALIHSFFAVTAHLEQFQLDLLKLPVGMFEDQPRMGSVEELLDYILLFFNNQQLISGEFMTDFIGFIWQQITTETTQRWQSGENSFIATFNTASEVWNRQEAYMHELGVKQPFINLDWRNLSSGEKAFLDLHSRLYYARQKVAEKLDQGFLKEIAAPVTDKAFILYVLIDEAEAGFHPLWQQEYFKTLHDLLVRLFADIDCRIQLFISSHSPFLLSDLPAANIIRMDDPEGIPEAEGNLDKWQQTMAANILELYDDTFFLPNGDIGEFARDRINRFIEKIEEPGNAGDILAKEAFIEAIGDPYLRENLKEQLRLSRPIDRQLQDALNEVERLKKLRDDQNRPQ